MNERTTRLRQQSLETPPSISEERALRVTEFYKEHGGRLSVAVMRARCFERLCQRKTLWIGEGELIVGERGPAPKRVPTYPELTCHTLEDLRILNTREKTRYLVSGACMDAYETVVIPYWEGRSMRDRLFAELPEEWHEAYGAGIFTEFMEQRAPGHTVLDGKIYGKGLLEFKEEIAGAIDVLDFSTDREAYGKREQLRAMAIACDAAIHFAHRHAILAEEMAVSERDAVRRA
jgi:formate C-acetyltransferase